jgi:hypothetical protein
LALVFVAYQLALPPGGVSAISTRLLPVILAACALSGLESRE